MGLFGGPPVLLIGRADRGWPRWDLMGARQLCIGGTCTSLHGGCSLFSGFLAVMLLYVFMDISHLQTYRGRYDKFQGRRCRVGEISDSKARRQ
jgi:hypothetical protein